MDHNQHGDLHSVFTAAEQLFTSIDTAERQHADSVQEQIQENIRQFMRVGELIREYSVFSPNETVDEIDTGDLRYLLAAAYLGDLVLKLNVDTTTRQRHLQASEEYIAVFLRQCKRLGLLRAEDELVLANAEPQDAVVRRELKIGRYKREKQAKERLQELTTHIRHAETRAGLERDHMLALIDCWIHRSCGNLGFARQEQELLKGVEELREANGGTLPTPDLPKSKGIKPFVITREMVRVFGAGYPSLPTLTVEQAAAREHAMGLHTCAKDDEGARQAKADLLNEDSLAGEMARDEQNAKDRRWDAFKDDNPYGAGNRYNKS